MDSRPKIQAVMYDKIKTSSGVAEISREDLFQKIISNPDKIKKKYIDAVKKYKDVRVAADEVRNEHNQTLLYMAIDAGQHQDIVVLLMRKGASVVARTSPVNLGDERIYSSTPLLLAAEKVGFSVGNPLFYFLLDQANLETNSLEQIKQIQSDSLDDYPVLKNCILEIALPLVWHFSGYARSQKEYCDNVCKESGVISNHEMASRAKELALMWQVLIVALKNMDFISLLENLSTIQNNAKYEKEDALHDEVADLLNEKIKWLDANGDQYHAEFKRYHNKVNTTASVYTGDEPDRMFSHATVNRQDRVEQRDRKTFGM